MRSTCPQAGEGTHLFPRSQSNPISSPLPIRACALELAQQLVAALHRLVERGLRRLAAGKRLLQLVLDHAADQHEGAEADALRILRRRMQRDLLERNRRAGVAVVKT